MGPFYFARQEAGDRELWLTLWTREFVVKLFPTWNSPPQLVTVYRLDRVFFLDSYCAAVQTPHTRHHTQNYRPTSFLSNTDISILQKTGVMDNLEEGEWRTFSNLLVLRQCRSVKRVVKLSNIQMEFPGIRLGSAGKKKQNMKIFLNLALHSVNLQRLHSWFCTEFP